MKKVFIICVFLVTCLGGVRPVSAGEDTQYWSSWAVDVALTEKITLKLLEEFYLKHEGGNFYLYDQYAGAGFKFTDYFDMALWYKLVSSKKNQHWAESHRFDIDANTKANLGSFRVSNRSRFERNTTASSWLYRDKIKIAKSLRVGEKEVTPFIADEFFLDITPSDGYNQNRAFVGVSTGFISDSRLTVYYMTQSKKKSGDWSNTHVVGTEICFSF